MPSSHSISVLGSRIMVWPLVMLIALGLSGCDGNVDEVPEVRPAGVLAVGDPPMRVVSMPEDGRAAEIRGLFEGLEKSGTLIESYARLAAMLDSGDGALLLEGFDGTSNGTKRWILARLMGHVGAADTADRLRAMVRSDESPHVRRNAAFALGWLGHGPAVDDLVTALRSDAVAFVQIACAVAIHDILGDASATVLTRELRNATNSDVKSSVAWLLDRRFRGTVDPQGGAGKLVDASYNGTRYKLYLPTGYTGDVSISLLVVVHDSKGTPEPFANMWIEDADRIGFAVLAPHFDYPTFPNYDALGIGVHATRSDTRLLDIIGQVSEDHSIQTDQFFLFGHGQGGQFVTRFALAHPDRIYGAVAAGSGSYVPRNPNVHFPNGTKANPFGPDLAVLDFGSLVRKKLGIVLGDRESQPRKIAAREFMGEIAGYARERGLESKVQLLWVPGGNHSGVSNQPTASAFLFGR